jgi:hypothetical protein
VKRGDAVSCPQAPVQVTSEKGTRKSYISVSDSILQKCVQSMQLPAQKEKVDDQIMLMSGFLMFTCILQHIFSLIFTIEFIEGVEAKIVIMKWTMRPQYLGRCFET